MYALRSASPKIIRRGTWVVNTAALIWPILVLLFSREELSHPFHQRFLIVNAIKSGSHTHRIAKEKTLVQHLSATERAAGNVPRQPEQFYSVPRIQVSYD